MMAVAWEDCLQHVVSLDHWLDLAYDNILFKVT